MGAVSPYLFVSTLPSGIALPSLILTVICGFKCSARTRVFCVFPLFFLIVTLAVNHRISQRLALFENKPKLVVTGVIGSLPENSSNGVRFLFLPDNPVKPIPSKIQVHWYKDRHNVESTNSNVPRIRAGERWRLHLVLRSPRGRVNFHGVDAERWYFTEGIGALAYVGKGKNIRLAGPGRFSLLHWRESVLDKLTETAGEKPGFRVLAALAIADRRGLISHDREILAATGTGHLLAISGLHIGLAAIMGFYLGKAFLIFSPTGQIQRVAVILPWLFSWLMAFSYSALSGFGVSTQRALIMLTVATVVSVSRRNTHPFQAWLIAMSLVLVADPFAPLRAGFWFSFIAVGVLMMLFVPRHGIMPRWRRMLFAQLGISLLMAPLGMYWFQQASLPGLLANLVAIPLVSMWTVPSLLASLVLLSAPGPMAAWLLTVSGYSVHWLLLFLEYLSGLQPEGFSSTVTPGFAATLLAMLGAAVLMLPRGIPGRYVGLLLMCPLLFPAGTPIGQTETQIDFLDVGQGLAVLLTTRDYQLVYDTGPGNGLDGDDRLDMVSGTIKPMIDATGRTPDLVVASHADLDHAGGLDGLRSEYPGAIYLASLPLEQAGINPCSTPRSWTSANTKFSIVHPSASLPYLGNDSSCVISVKGPGLSLLLSGDISRVVEQRLVDEGLGQHTIMSAPHHGSSTSSSQALIDAVRPAWVLISAAAGNHFGFPRADVLERYAKAHIPTLNTAQCGGIRVTTNTHGSFRIESARISRKAIWRWPAMRECP